jgi:tetratricopeptide (TPR) repeat protein
MPGLPMGSSGNTPAAVPVKPPPLSATAAAAKQQKISTSGPNLKVSTAKVQAAKPPPAGSGEDFSDETGRLERAAPSDPNLNPKKGAVEIGEAGILDAEAALEAMTSFRLAEGALQRNDTAAAEQHARKAVEGDPSHVDYISLLAWIRSLGNAPQAMEDAIRTMSKVLIEDPSNERALFYRGKLLVRTNRLPEALHDFNELLSANPSHKEAQAEVQILKTKVSS